MTTDPAPPSHADVLIAGGGLAGLLLARQLRQEFPHLSVTVMERTRRPLPDACHKVGESSVELGSQYLERLGLEDYLLDQHIVKFGLRFFPGGGHRPLAERAEIGPMAEPRVRSYQLDRGRLENDLRAMNEGDGVTLVEGARVGKIELAEGGAGDHRVEFAIDGRTEQHTCRWLVDATGRQALLRKRMKLQRAGRHDASASWFRVKGRLDINALAHGDAEFAARPGADIRWRSTNHLMGRGYWVWLIPLATGNTSVGIVLHNEEHDADSTIGGIDRTLAWIRRHEPVLADQLEHEEILDFGCVKNYCHRIARGWSADRWALVGEAGAFVDPLYSPGTDFICIANSFTVEMIRTAEAGRDAPLQQEDLQQKALQQKALQQKALFLNTQYRALTEAAINLFRHAAPVYGHASSLAAKIYWDDFVYWTFTCRYMTQEVYRMPEEQFAPFGVLGNRYRELGLYVQEFLAAWAALAPETPERSFRAVPAVPSMLIDTHRAVPHRTPPEEALSTMTGHLRQAETIAAEIALRGFESVGPEVAELILKRCPIAAWHVPLSEERIATAISGESIDDTELTPVARDVHATLGSPRRHADAARSLTLVQSALRTATAPA